MVPQRAQGAQGAGLTKEQKLGAETAPRLTEWLWASPLPSLSLWAPGSKDVVSTTDPGGLTG